LISCAVTSTIAGVGLLGRDPWKDGVRSIATIERVCVTASDHDPHHNQRSSQEVFLAFAFTDERGQPVLQERKWFMVDIPPPGTLVDVAYMPGKTSHLDYDQHSFRPPDPSVPRGWGAGVFEVPDIGTHRPEQQDAGLAADRELFRSGRRVPAQVVGVEHDEWARHGAYGHVLTVEAEGKQSVSSVRLPLACAPPDGAGILIAIGEDGTVALDADERFYGPPGRALVFSQPPAGYQARTSQQVQTDAVDRAAGMLQAAESQKRDLILAQIERVAAMRDQGKMSEAVFESTKAGLLAQIDGSPSANAGPAADRLARLEAARAAGRLTEKQYEQMKAALSHRR
jgi:hypothetical protein